MSAPKAKTYNVHAVLEQARAGSLTLSEMKRQIRKMEERGTAAALQVAMDIREIVQRKEGRKAVEEADDVTPGSAKWAFAQLGAAPVTPYRWSGTTAEGRVVVALWDEPGRFGPDLAPRVAESLERIKATANDPALLQNRRAYFRDLEVAAAKHGGLVTAILATAVDINAIPRKRKPGSCRPWLNEDGSPVVLRIKHLDLAKYSYAFELSEPHKRPRSPFDQTPCA